MKEILQIQTCYKRNELLKAYSSNFKATSLNVSFMRAYSVPYQFTMQKRNCMSSNVTRDLEVGYFHLVERSDKLKCKNKRLD